METLLKKYDNLVTEYNKTIVDSFLVWRTLRNIMKYYFLRTAVRLKAILLQ